MLLKLDHLGAETIEKRLPGIREIAIKFANVDPIKDPIPVVPTMHYQMGGIPTNYHGQVVAPRGGNPNAVVEGFYAVGECACVSVHGANRLGTNSLLDLLVFGKRRAATISSITITRPASTARCRRRPARRLRRGSRRWTRADKGERVQEVADAMRKTMQAHCGVFRFRQTAGRGRAQDQRDRRAGARTWRSRTSRKVFNTARIEALELDNLDRDCHGDDRVGRRAQGKPRRPRPRDDYPERDDVNWLKHTLWYSRTATGSITSPST